MTDFAKASPHNNDAEKLRTLMNEGGPPGSMVIANPALALMGHGGVGPTKGRPWRRLLWLSWFLR